MNILELIGKDLNTEVKSEVPFEIVGSVDSKDYIGIVEDKKTKLKGIFEFDSPVNARYGGEPDIEKMPMPMIHKFINNPNDMFRSSPYECNWCKRYDDKVALYGGDFEVFTEYKYDSIDSFDNVRGFAKYRIGEKYGLILMDGKEITPAEFDSIQIKDVTPDEDYNQVYSEYVIVKKDNKYGVYNVDTRKYTLPIEYDSIGLRTEEIDGQTEYSYSPKKDGKTTFFNPRSK